ncbi:MAG: glycerol-3-phosphate 1-O-acyltransferase [Betaproteobacteria bacterium]|nr:glycerol-3-phosphate 1-O-acyltransferase [Betaproteobacteria bacterium]
MTVAVIILGYLMGSLSFAVMTAKLFGLPDPRTYGSGNPGATNVLRSGKKLAALITLLGDASKGAIAIGIAHVLLAESSQLSTGIALTGLAAFLGHLYPVFFRFKGGKGVATALGILLAFHWMLGIAVLAVWLGVVGATRYVSLAGVVAAVAAAPVAAYLSASAVMVMAVSVMGLLILWRHGGNLRRLRAGTESKVFANKS